MSTYVTTIVKRLRKACHIVGILTLAVGVVLVLGAAQHHDAGLYYHAVALHMVSGLLLTLAGRHDP